MNNIVLRLRIEIIIGMSLAAILNAACRRRIYSRQLSRILNFRNPCILNESNHNWLVI